jgi:AraC-like DNA-binding protein
VATFGPRLQFGHQFTGLVFFAAELHAPNTVSDPLLRPYAQQLLQALPAPPAATMTGQVTSLVEMLLPLGRCSTRQVARSLGVTERTLHRRLTAEGQSFSSIVHETRESLAERYLATDRYSQTDVSELLGFTAPSAFSRWFRQRFGASPTEWRITSGRVAGV